MMTQDICFGVIFISVTNLGYVYGQESVETETYDRDEIATHTYGYVDDKNGIKITTDEGVIGYYAITLEHGTHDYYFFRCVSENVFRIRATCQYEFYDYTKSVFLEMIRSLKVKR